MYFDVSASAKVESTQVIDMEDKINSCLADVRGDANDVVDVIRKAITDDDDTRYCNVDTFYVAIVEKFLLIFRTL